MRVRQFGNQVGGNSGLFVGYRRGASDGDGHDDWFELSGPARQGDSGGPIFNERGRVVGILWGTDGKTVIGVQAGRLHVALQEATKFYRPQADRPDLNLVPVVFPPEIERNPTPPMTREGECCPGGECRSPGRGVDVQIGSGKKPVLPWRGDELKRDAALEAKIRAQQAEIDGLVELERARQNTPPAIAERQNGAETKPQADAPSPLLAAIVIVGSLAVGGFFYSKTKKEIVATRSQGMQSFQQVPALWQYVIFGLAGLVLGYAIVAVHNKIMEGRKWCIKIAQGCTTAGLTDLATFFTELGTGDLIDAEKQALKWAADMNDPTKRMALLAQAVEDSVQYVAANDLGVATKILAILQNGAASKSLFAASPPRHQAQET